MRSCLARLLPLIAEENSFALKGGTAVNLFVRNRLPVDIDLTYVPVREKVFSPNHDGVRRPREGA